MKIKQRKAWERELQRWFMLFEIMYWPALAFGIWAVISLITGA